MAHVFLKHNITNTLGQFVGLFDSLVVSLPVIVDK